MQNIEYATFHPFPCCGMYVPLSDDKHRFVQKVHPARANGHWEQEHNSNPVATLPYAVVVLYATI